MSGWRYAPQRQNEARLHDQLVPWSELSETVRNYDRDLVRAIPELVPIRRELVVGITGHRPNKLGHTDMATLHHKVAEALDDLRMRYPDRAVVVLSALAEGADRLVAKLAMEKLAAELWFVMPMPFAIYRLDFLHADEAEADRLAEDSLAELNDLLKGASRVLELPLKFGTLREVGAGGEARRQQYALAGAYIIERCDVLIAVWDDKPEEGIGGTAQVVRWRRQGRPEAPYSTATDFFPRPEMQEPIVIPP